VAVVSNGSHTDVIAEKIASGMSIRDSLALSLMTMDYEKDDFNTPRIAGATTLDGESYIGIVTHEKVQVEKIPSGEASYISTYEHITPNQVKFTAGNVSEAAQFIMDGGKFSEFTNPVTSAAAFGKDNWELKSI
jgi:IMP cyclohydrolase